MMKIIVVFRNFANTPNKETILPLWNSLSEGLTVSASHPMHIEVFKTTKACVCCTSGGPFSWEDNITEHSSTDMVGSFRYWCGTPLGSTSRLFNHALTCVKR